MKVDRFNDNLNTQLLEMKMQTDDMVKGGLLATIDTNEISFPISLISPSQSMSASFSFLIFQRG